MVKYGTGIVQHEMGMADSINCAGSFERELGFLPRGLGLI